LNNFVGVKLSNIKLKKKAFVIEKYNFFRFAVLAFATSRQCLSDYLAARGRATCGTRKRTVSGHSLYDERRNRGHSSAVVSSAVFSDSLFLSGFSYSSGTFSLQPLPETFKKAALPPICHLFLSASAAKFCFSRALHPSRLLFRLESPARKRLALSRSFVSFDLALDFLFVTVLFRCAFRLHGTATKISIRSIAKICESPPYRCVNSVSRRLNRSFRKKTNIFADRLNL